MFAIGDTIVYKGHGLVKVAAVSKARRSAEEGGGIIAEDYYVLKSARTPLLETKLMVKVEGAEKAIRNLLSSEECKAVIDAAGGESEELPEDHKERIAIIDALVEKNDPKELASLVRDYRESKLLNLERDEIKRVKAIARNLAEELCHVLKMNRAGLQKKFSIRSVG